MNYFVRTTFILHDVCFLVSNITLQVAVDILTRFSHSVACDIRLNHGSILNAIWSWVGIEDELRHSVARVWL